MGQQGLTPRSVPGWAGAMNWTTVDTRILVSTPTGKRQREIELTNTLGSRPEPKRKDELVPLLFFAGLYPVAFGLYVGQDSFLLVTFIALTYHNSAPLQVG